MTATGPLNEAPPKAVPRGGALSLALTKRIKDLQITQKEAATRIGISPSYFGSLMSFERWWGTLTRERLIAVANFLDVPTINVLMMAELVESSDYFKQSNVAEEMEKALARLKGDARYATMMPLHSSWDVTPPDVKLLCALLYNDLSGRDIMQLQAMLLKPTMG